MGIAYSPTQQLSKTARMPIKLARCWRNAQHRGRYPRYVTKWRAAEPSGAKMIGYEVKFFNSVNAMIRKLASGKYRLYSRKKNPKTGRRRNLGTFATRTAGEKHERAVQFYKRH
jgi:hypothetical protein